MNRNTISSAVPPQWWDRLKGAQFGFIGGLLVGILLGWFFHGVISLVVRLGFLMLLLLPLLAIGWLWLRSQRASGNNQTGEPPVTTWTAVGSVTTTRPPVRSTPVSPDFEPGPLIDVPVVKPRAESRPDDIEAELQALKRQQERGA